MPAKLDSCVEQLKKQLRTDHPDWSAEKISEVAWATCVKSTGLSPEDEEGIAVNNEEMKWTSNVSVHESFNSAMSTVKRPQVKVIHGLEESRLENLQETTADVASNESHFFIVGEAIHATTTANMHTYLAEELESSAETLVGVPVMVDHAKTSENVAGKVLVSTWEDRAGLDGTVSYVARIRKTHPVSEAVRVGDISTVSIGASAEHIECSICGDDMRTCAHHIGQSYEMDGEEKLATAIGRGLTFRELSVTPFPADTRASARVNHNSLFSAMEMLVESHEYKPQLQKAGVNKKMSEDNNEELATVTSALDEAKGEIEQLHKDKEEARLKVEQFQKREKAALAERVFEMEVAANVSKSEDELARKTELTQMSPEVLSEKIRDLKKFSDITEKMNPPTSKAVLSDAPVKTEPVKDPLVYAREDVKAGLRQALGGMRTSDYARTVSRKWALDSQNPMSQEYRALVKKNISEVLTGGNK